MIEEIVVLSALLLGAIADMRTREVPDTLSFGLIGIGFLMAAASSLANLTLSPFINAAAGFVAGYALGLLFYFTGMWGGGDAKIIMGVGAVMGLGVFSLWNNLPLFIVFIINTFVVGAIYGSCWMIMLGLKHFSEFKKEFENVMNEKSVHHLKLVLFIFLGIVVLISLFAPIYFGFKIAAVIIALVFVLFFYLSLVIKAVEKSVMYVNLPVSKLTEGDWLIEKVKLSKGKYLKPNKTGISFEDISLLKKHNIKSVKVKEGVPFIPSFFIAYIVTIIFQNWLVLIF